MSRTPFIAGNWKLHKTIAEAEAFIRALLPRVSTADGVQFLDQSHRTFSGEAILKPERAPARGRGEASAEDKLKQRD